MNHLAHAYLSASEGELIGNMIADFIRNRERFLYPEEIQKGIRLHREIDTFTDAHPVVHEAKKIFSPLVRLYSGAFIDVAFDYFLAQKLSENNSDFLQFTQNVYKTLWQNEIQLPENYKIVLKNMEKDNWLYNYQFDWGIEYSMKNVLNKAKYLDKNIPVFEVFLANKERLQIYFDEFFPDLKAHCQGFRTVGKDNDPGN